MERLELKDSLINLYEDDELTYSFNWERLSDIWDYATLDDVEGISANYVDGLMSVILTTAEGQGGIVAVVDTANDEIIHYHDGSFAVRTLMAGDRIVTLYHVMSYSPYQLVEQHETRANRAAVHEFSPVEKIEEAVNYGNTELSQIAEYLSMPEEFVSMAIETYRLEGELD